MQNEQEVPKDTKSTDEDYEAPAIENVVTPEELAREVHYAGLTDQTVPTG